MAVTFLDDNTAPSKVTFLDDAPQSPQTTPSGFPEPQISDNPPAGAEKPVEQKLAENAQQVGSGMGLGALATAGAIGLGKGISGLFEPSPDLLNAGIKPTTVLKMTPHGQNPAEYGKALEDSLNKAGAIGKDASETWQKMNSLKNVAGQSVGDSLNAISSQTGQPLSVDANTALKPIVDGWAERAGAATSARKAMARPFEQIYNSLAQKAASQGGTIHLDDIRGAMDEIGPLVHKGPEAVQEAMHELYGVLADARDGIVNQVARKANNPQLAQNLLNANAEYSKYMRLMPDVSRAAATSAVKQGVSTFQKIGGPTIARYIAAYTVGSPIVHRLNELIGGK